MKDFSPSSTGKTYGKTLIFHLNTLVLRTAGLKSCILQYSLVPLVGPASKNLAAFRFASMDLRIYNDVFVGPVNGLLNANLFTLASS